MTDMPALSLFRLGHLLNIISLGCAPKSGYLYYFVLKAYMRKPESPAHEPTVMKEAFYLAGGRIGSYVKILWRAPQHKVTDASPHQICDKSTRVEAVQDTKGVHAHLPA